MIRVSSNSPATFCGGAAAGGRSAQSERRGELDPRNFDILQQIALSYQHLGRYAGRSPRWIGVNDRIR
jgi:hypothetical protein